MQDSLPIINKEEIMFKIICLIFVSMLTFYNTGLSFDKMEIPVLSVFGDNLFTDDQMKILFVDGFKGLYSIDLITKRVDKIDDFKLVMGIHSTPKGIFLIYNKYDKSNGKNISELLSVLGDGYHERVLRKYSKEYGHAYPMVAPDGKHIALTEYSITSDTIDLIIIEKDSERQKYVARMEKEHTLPVFLWSGDSNLLYYLRSDEKKTEFCIYNVRNDKIETIHREANIEVFYTFPTLLNNRHILYLGKDSNGRLIIGKYDVTLSLTTVKRIDISDNYDSFMMSISELPDNLFLCQAIARNPKRNKILLFDNSLEIKGSFDIDGEELTPIAFNRIAKRMLFFRNETELIGISFVEPLNIETIFSKTQNR